MPQAIFAPADRGDLPSPRVFIAPQRRIQGRGVLGATGRYLSLVRSAVLDAHRLGTSVAQRVGDAASRRLHAD